jgi:hypothetical protein
VPGDQPRFNVSAFLRRRSTSLPKRDQTNTICGRHDNKQRAFVADVDRPVGIVDEADESRSSSLQASSHDAPTLFRFPLSKRNREPSEVLRCPVFFDLTVGLLRLRILACILCAKGDLGGRSSSAVGGFLREGCRGCFVVVSLSEE